MGIIKRILTTTVALSLAFILGTAVIGSHHVEAAADPIPDLIVLDIALSPENPSIGDTVTFTVTIKNQGTETAGSSHIACYVDDVFLTSELVDPVNAGATVIETLTWEAQGGTHVIKVVADSNNQVTELDEANNVKTFTLSTLAPDLIIQSISWTPVNPSKGDSIVFSVTIKNQGSGSARSSRLNFYIDGSSRGYQDVCAIDAGAAVTKTYTWVARVGQHDVKAVADEDNHVEESDETNNEQTVTFSTLPPDLIVKSITWSPENPSKRDDVTVNVTIENQGSGRADACHVAYYIDGTYLTSEYIAQMAAGASTNTTFGWIASTDSHDIKVIVDSNQRVAESDETNNESTVNLLTLRPDLVIESVTWSPTEAGVGDDVTFSVTITNQGSGKAATSRIGCYISGCYTGYLDVPWMEAGTTITTAFTWTAEVGSRIVSIVADHDNRVIEINEDNNKETATIFITAPDLIVENIAWSPEKPSLGDEVTFDVTITNQGGGAAGYFYVAYYVDEAYLTSGYIGQMAAGASTNVTFNWVAEIGSHTFRAVADHFTVVMEDDETNNENTVSLSPVVPDLTIDSITWSPQIFSAGDTVNFAVTITNQGTDRAGSSRAAYYIDDSIAGYQHIQDIDAGAAVTENFLWTAVAGSHAIRISVDSNEQVTESDETNNAKTVNMPPPDLVIQDVTWSPTDAAVGDIVTFDVTINNQGSGRANSSSVTYYVDGSPVGNRDLPEVNAGVTVTNTFAWLAEVGQHVIRVAADANNQVMEIDETNNDEEIDFLTLAPDLIIQDITWSQDNPLNSDEVTFNIIIENQGSSQAENFSVACYIDGSPAGDREVAEIAPGATVTEIFLITVEAVPHTFKVAADSSNQVAEIDETNNEEEMDFSSLTPDPVVQDITWLPQSPLPGDTVTFTVLIGNQGRDKAENLSVALYIDGSSAGSHDVPRINAGATITKTFTWLAEIGSHEIRAVVDLGELVVESNEANNTAQQTLSLEETEGISDLAAQLASSRSQNGGILENSWWLLYLAAVLFGGIAFIAIFKSSRK